MIIAPEIIHDLKTERADVLPPLPITLRLVPVVFYLGALGVIIVAALTFIQIGNAAIELEKANAQVAEIQQSMDELKKSRTALEVRTKHAVELVKWVEGSVAVQPLIVTISRSIAEKSAIMELSLGRDEKASGQLQLALKLQAANGEQLEATVESIRRSGFRPFSARQSQEGNRLTYEATLIREASSRPEATAPPNE